jgi:hypothetical protein
LTFILCWGICLFHRPGFHQVSLFLLTFFIRLILFYPWPSLSDPEFLMCQIWLLEAMMSYVWCIMLQRCWCGSIADATSATLIRLNRETTNARAFIICSCVASFRLSWVFLYFSYVLLPLFFQPFPCILGNLWSVCLYEILVRKDWPCLKGRFLRLSWIECSVFIVTSMSFTYVCYSNWCYSNILNLRQR